MSYRNPVLSGFYPDPSVCRVGDDYYLVNSSFEYFPGVPLHHSKDLVNWRQIGHCLTRSSQLPLSGCYTSGGIYAPTIRHHDGRFYMVTTNVTGGGNFIVHADNPAGEWSEPVWLRELGGIDPSLFFDDDGTCYFTSNGDGMIVAPLDLKSGRVLEAPRPFWRGTGAQAPEGPHLYKVKGVYYALLAEGGTEYGHFVSIARGPSPLGPWEVCPRNPLFSHRSMSSPIQATGHADLIEAHDGSWWMVFLGVRPVYYPPSYHLGRETFLAPVTWQDGWPIVNEGRVVSLQMEAPSLRQHPWPEPAVRDDFDAPTLGMPWNCLRNPRPEAWSLHERLGYLRLKGSAITLDHPTESPSWVGRRQQHFYCRAETQLHFQPGRDGDEAGMTALMNERHHYEVAVTRVAGQRQVLVRRRIGSLQVVTAARPLRGNAPVTLHIRSTPKAYTFAVAEGEEPLADLDTAEIRYIATEAAGGFTGIYLGLYATGNGAAASAPADFDWFDYQQTEEEPTGKPR